MLVPLVSNIMFGADLSPVTGADHPSPKIQFVASRRLKTERAA
jgi:hypothetical protein